MTAPEIAEMLKAHDIRPTPQRIAVYQYLDSHRIHAAADTIYESLVEHYPSFSKTTIYNSIRVLEENGLIQPIVIDGGFVRYDANISPHGHFKCFRCGKVYDVMDCPAPALPDSLRPFETRSCVLNYYGFCPECRASQKSSQPGGCLNK